MAGGRELWQARSQPGQSRQALRGQQHPNCSSPAECAHPASAGGRGPSICRIPSRVDKLRPGSRIQEAGWQGQTKRMALRRGAPVAGLRFGIRALCALAGPSAALLTLPPVAVLRKSGESTLVWIYVGVADSTCTSAVENGTSIIVVTPWPVASW